MKTFRQWLETRRYFGVYDDENDDPAEWDFDPKNYRASGKSMAQAIQGNELTPLNITQHFQNQQRQQPQQYTTYTYTQTPKTTPTPRKSTPKTTSKPPEIDYEQELQRRKKVRAYFAKREKKEQELKQKLQDDIVKRNTPVPESDYPSLADLWKMIIKKEQAYSRMSVKQTAIPDQIDPSDEKTLQKRAKIDFIKKFGVTPQSYIGKGILAKYGGYNSDAPRYSAGHQSLTYNAVQKALSPSVPADVDETIFFNTPDNSLQHMIENWLTNHGIKGKVDLETFKQANNFPS